MSDVLYKTGVSALNKEIDEFINGCGTADEFEQAELRQKIDKIMKGVPEGKARRRLIGKVRKRIENRIDGTKVRIAGIQAEQQHLVSAVDATDRVLEWLGQEYILQKPVGTALHTFQQALADGHIFNLSAKDAKVDDIAAWEEIADSASVFMVEHDWAAAFKNARDYLGGEIKLPDDVCAFEFRISDRHVIVFATDADGSFYLQYAVQVRKGWLLMPIETNGSTDSLFHFACSQIKAIAVALDAEIATTEVVRAPHKLNHARERAGKTPMVSYHVVKLSHRSRLAPLPSDDHEPAYHVRLHFRRGHWRHFENHKTWIKWMLVGNPELGFVDKEYRL